MSDSRKEFEKKFKVPAHWIEFDERLNKYYCPYVADSTANEYQKMWVVWQEQQKKIDAVLKHIDHEGWTDEYGDKHCPVQRIKELLK